MRKIFTSHNKSDEAGKNHFLLQKVNLPASDNYFTLQCINKYATEGELLLDKKLQFRVPEACIISTLKNAKDTCNGIDAIMTTSDVAQALGMSLKSALKRLIKLRYKNKVIGVKHSVWLWKYNDGQTIEASDIENKIVEVTRKINNKISESNRGKIPWDKGRKNCYSEETLKNMSIHNRLKNSAEGREKMSEFLKGRIPWNKGKKGVQAGEKHPMYGKHHLAKTNLKISETKKMQYAEGKIVHWNKGNKGLHTGWRGKHSEATKKKMHKPHPSIQGEKNYRWRGGKKLYWARQSGKKRARGFIMVVKTNPFAEPVDYHHIHLDLPYVIPCPSRVHKMFLGNKNHCNLVNAFLGFRFECCKVELKENNLER